MIMHSVLAMSALAFAPSQVPLGAPTCSLSRRATCVQLVAADSVDAAAAKLRKAASRFGSAQKDAAEGWLTKTLASGSFSSSELLEARALLFEECLIDDDGSSNCQALDEAMVDLQGAMAALTSDQATTSAKRLAQNKVNKAAMAVRAAAGRFGVAQKKMANEWLEKTLGGRESAASLMEESLLLFGECELSEEGSKAPNKCAELSKAIESLRMAMGDVADVQSLKSMTGNVVPVAQMSDMQYRKWLAGEAERRQAA